MSDAETLELWAQRIERALSEAEESGTLHDLRYDPTPDEDDALTRWSDDHPQKVQAVRDAVQECHGVFWTEHLGVRYRIGNREIDAWEYAKRTAMNTCARKIRILQNAVKVAERKLPRPTKRGAPRQYDAAQDAKLYADWREAKANGTQFYLDFANDRGMPLPELKAALHRHETRQTKPRQEERFNEAQKSEPRKRR
jgi:hypothetical protein